VPPFRRAYNQLKMNVRALPTCRKPVGDGANRTRSIIGEYSKGNGGTDRSSRDVGNLDRPVTAKHGYLSMKAANQGIAARIHSN
jgi:hypothetical protein